MFAAALVAPFVAIRGDAKLVYGGLVLGLFALATVISHARCSLQQTPDNGSLWCLLGTLVPVAAIFVNGSPAT